MRVAVVLDERCLRHDPGPEHPDSPERLRALLPLLEGPARLDGIERIAGRLARSRELERVHSPAHVRSLTALARGGATVALDADTGASRQSPGAARAAAGAGLALLDRLAAGRADAGFALVRPPGHHAERDRVGGFCLLNNAAVATAHAMAVHAMARVMILDWDVHHGGATQAIFETDPEVLYLSMHSGALWPGTGSLLERGTQLGLWTTVNVPLEPGRGDADYLALMRDLVRPAALAFRPSLIVVAAGFDAHADDPIGDMRVTTRGFGGMAAILGEIARELGGVPLLLVLEGGYDVPALAGSVRAVLEALRDDREPPAARDPSAAVRERIAFVRDLHGDFARLRRIGAWGFI